MLATMSPIKTENKSYLALTSQYQSPEEDLIKHSKLNVVPSSRSNTRKIGYDPAIILDDIPNRNLCMLCSFAMREPIQTSNGELACKGCYEERKRITDDVFKTGEKIEYTHPDRATAREIDTLNCKCINHENGCQWKGIIKELENHVESCPYSPAECFYCQETTSDIQQHFNDCKYFEELDSCPYDGCNFKPSPECCIYSHIKEDAFFHMALQEKFIKGVLQEKDELYTQIKELKDDFQRQISKKDEQITELSLMLTDLSTQVKKLQKSVDNYSKQEASKVNIAPATSEFPRLTAELLNCERKFQELDLKQQLLENTNYDGDFLWKIDNYTARRQQAKTGEITALHSAPCFTSRYGYKFCARLYLNGDGDGSGTHMSIFFVLMKSEYDNVNSFPFTKRVSFKLRSQEDPTKYLEESFKPDKASSSFQKPTKNMNIAAGCPMFIPHEDLEKGGYIKDDCFFLEISTTS